MYIRLGVEANGPLKISASRFEQSLVSEMVVSRLPIPAHLPADTVIPGSPSARWRDNRMTDTGQLKVLLRRAVGLQQSAGNQLLHPYVIFQSGQVECTSRVSQACDPEWNHLNKDMLILTGERQQFIANGLLIQVMDLDSPDKSCRQNESIGNVEVSLRVLEDATTQEFSKQLSTQGCIEFSVTWEPISLHMLSRGMMHVHVAHATGLKNNARKDLPDPYIRLSQGGTTHRTTAVKKDLNPHWHENFVFVTGVLHEITRAPLILHVCDWDRFGTDDPLGNASVSLRCLEASNNVQLSVPLSQHGVVHLSIAWQADGQAVPPLKWDETKGSLLMPRCTADSASPSNTAARASAGRATPASTPNVNESSVNSSCCAQSACSPPYEALPRTAIDPPTNGGSTVEHGTPVEVDEILSPISPPGTSSSSSGMRTAALVYPEASPAAPSPTLKSPSERGSIACSPLANTLWERVPMASSLQECWDRVGDTLSEASGFSRVQSSAMLLGLMSTGLLLVLAYNGKAVVPDDMPLHLFPSPPPPQQFLPPPLAPLTNTLFDHFFSPKQKGFASSMNLMFVLVLFALVVQIQLCCCCLSCIWWRQTDRQTEGSPQTAEKANAVYNTQCDRDDLEAKGGHYTRRHQCGHCRGSDELLRHDAVAVHQDTTFYDDRCRDAHRVSSPSNGANNLCSPRSQSSRRIHQQGSVLAPQGRAPSWGYSEGRLPPPASARLLDHNYQESERENHHYVQRSALQMARSMPPRPCSNCEEKASHVTSHITTHSRHRQHPFSCNVRNQPAIHLKHHQTNSYGVPSDRRGWHYVEQYELLDDYEDSGGGSPRDMQIDCGDTTPPHTKVRLAPAYVRAVNAYLQQHGQGYGQQDVSGSSSTLPRLH